MSSDLEQFKIKISAYSVDQLEEVLISLNKDKFPEKYQLVRETLANKKGKSAPLPSDNFQATVVDTSRAIGLQTPPPIAPSVVEVPAAGVIPAASAMEIQKPAEPLKVPEPVPLAPKMPVVSPVTSSLPLSSPKPEAATVSGGGTGGGLQGFFLFLVLLTSLVAAYCLLLPTMDLPGKAQVLDVARKLPELPAFKTNDLQQSKNESAEDKAASTQSPTPKKPDAPQKN